MERVVVRLDASRREDFFRLHCAENGAGWCRCVAWWVPTWEGWGARAEAENLQLRQELFDRGEYDGYLLYVEGAPVGWCQAGPRDRLQKLADQFGLAPDPDTWAITCFLIAPEHRRQGHAAHLLGEALADLRRRGVQRVEAFPKRGAAEEAELWTGPEAMLREAGFRVVRDHAQRPVMAIDLGD